MRFKVIGEFGALDLDLDAEFSTVALLKQQICDEVMRDA